MDISQHIKRERAKAKALRKSRWWNNLCQSASCYYCHKSLDRCDITMDHIVPLSQGGKSNKGNLTISCKTCNSNKQSKTAVELLLGLC